MSVKCQHAGCESPATHLSGIGNGQPVEYQRLCPDHTNERLADDPRVWFRMMGREPIDGVDAARVVGDFFRRFSSGTDRFKYAEASATRREP